MNIFTTRRIREIIVALAIASVVLSVASAVLTGADSVPASAGFPLTVVSVILAAAIMP